jgi:hypothetical protein
MLREGWDVPPVSVILLLRKFSSRVYGQQVVGRGLRLNMRGEDAQEICAIVDHEKLKHDWLWEMVGAKIHKDVDQFTMFGEEDLPPKRKQQVIVNPDLLIEVPEPTEDEKADFDEDLDKIVIETGDYPDWQKILDGFNYAVETEITKVEIVSVEARPLDGSGFLELHEPPAPYDGGGAAPEDASVADLAETLKNSVRDIADDLLAEEGIGSHEKGYLYGVLMDHVSTRMLGGKTAGTASVEELRHALNRRHRMAANFKAMPGLVDSIVKYRKEAHHANQ